MSLLAIVLGFLSLWGVCAWRWTRVSLPVAEQRDRWMVYSLIAWFLLACVTFKAYQWHTELVWMNRLCQ